MRKRNTKPHSAGRSRAPEPSEIFVPGLVAFLVTIAFAALGIHAGVWAWLKTMNRAVGVDASSSYRFLDEGQFPKLQISPKRDWKSVRADEEHLLTRYSWVDKTSGIVRIPISEAIDRVVTGGLPHWGATNRAVSPIELQRERAAEGGLR